jgi:hypothetical protein
MSNRAAGRGQIGKPDLGSPVCCVVDLLDREPKSEKLLTRLIAASSKLISEAADRGTKLTGTSTRIRP